MKITWAVAAFFALSSGTVVSAEPPSQVSPAVRTVAAHLNARAARVPKRLSEMIVYLNLTPGQTAQIQTIMQGTQSKLRAIKMDTTVTPDQKRLEEKAARKDQREQITAVLTPDQQVKFIEFMRSHKKANPNTTTGTAAPDTTQ